MQNIICFKHNVKPDKMGELIMVEGDFVEYDHN